MSLQASQGRTHKVGGEKGTCMHGVQKLFPDSSCSGRLWGCLPAQPNEKTYSGAASEKRVQNSVTTRIV